MAGIWDMITGQNPNQSAINQQTSNATQATAAQNQIIQQALLPLYNQMLSSYDSNYQPLSNNLGSNLSSSSTTDALNLGPTAQATTNFFSNEANNGLSEASIGSAINPYNASTESNLNSIMNSLGAGTPNVAGLASQLNQQDLQGRIGLMSSLAGQNQQLQSSGAENAMNTQTGLLSALQNYLNSGNNLLTGGSSGMSSLANMYGNSATGAANSAMSLTNSGSSANSSTMTGLSGLAGALAGAGLFG